MIVVNTESVPGYEVVEVKGLVQGNTIRAKHLGRDIAANLKSLVGGELRGYTELLTEARRQSLERMMAQAQQLEANAVINVRFTTSAITQGAAELYAYGTAVYVQRHTAETPPDQMPGATMFRAENVPRTGESGR
ncbi:MAG: YbjQ family protein [Candidatus Hydrogenedentota bacterium]